MFSNNGLIEILSVLQKFILAAENLEKTSKIDKKEFVLSCLEGFIQEGETKKILMLLMPSLVDFAVSLMNQGKMLSLRKQCGCS